MVDLGDQRVDVQAGHRHRFLDDFDAQFGAFAQALDNALLGIAQIDQVLLQPVGPALENVALVPQLLAPVDGLAERGVEAGDPIPQLGLLGVRLTELPFQTGHALVQPRPFVEKLLPRALGAAQILPQRGERTIEILLVRGHPDQIAFDLGQLLDQLRARRRDLVALGVRAHQQIPHLRDPRLQGDVLAGDLEQVALKLLHFRAQALAREGDAGLLGLGALELPVDGGQVGAVGRRLLEQGQEVGLVLLQVARDSRELSVVLPDLGQEIEISQLMLRDLLVLAGDRYPVHDVAGGRVKAPGDHGDRGNRPDLLDAHRDAHMVKPVARAEKHLAWNKGLFQEIR